MVVVVELLLGVALFAGIIWFTVRRSYRRTGWGVVKALRQPGDSVRLSMGSLETFGLWNPGKPLSRVNYLNANNGVAEYQLDQDGLVSLDWTPKSGVQQHFRGPIPERFTTPMLRLSIRWALWGVLITYVVLTVAGAVVGWETSSRRSREGGAIAGAIFGFLAGWVILVLVGVGVRAGSTALPKSGS